MTSRYTLLDPIEIEADIAAAECALAGKRGPVSPWRPIETAPRDGTSVLIHDGEFAQMVAEYHKGSWLALMEYTYRPTHWMPLPPAPNTIDRDAMEGE
jgi:hypothetical protein